MNAYGFIYITTNLINGKKYIGQRSYYSKKVNNYLGSGKYLKQAIKKYGSENFSREIICNCLDKESLSFLEIYFISEYNAVADPMFYNVAEGGYCTRGFSGKTHSDETKIKQSINCQKRIITDKLRESSRNNIIKANKQPRSSERNEIARQSGLKNKDRKGYNDGVKNYSLFDNDPLIIELNLKRGHLKKNITIATKGKKHYNDGVKNYSLFDNDPKITELNLTLGLLKVYKTPNNPTLGRSCFNDGTRNYYFFEDDPRIHELQLFKGGVKLKKL